MFLFLLGISIFQCVLKKNLIDTVDINAKERILSVAEKTFRSAMYLYYYIKIIVSNFLALIPINRKSTLFSSLKYLSVTNRCYVINTLFLIIIKKIIRLSDILILRYLIIPHLGILHAL